MKRCAVPIVVFALSCGLLAASAVSPQAAPALSRADLQMKQNVLLLQGYINTAAAKNGFVYPPKATVKKGGGLPAPVWPASPWTGRAMAPGSGKGSYAYSLAADGHGYALVGHLSSGSYTVKGALPAWLTGERAATTTAQDRGIASGTALLWRYVGDWARAQGRLPSAVEFTPPAGDDPYCYWPRDPVRGNKMQPGTGPGEYTYTPSSDGSFTLAGHLTDGDVVTFTGPAIDWAADKDLLTIEGTTFISYGLELQAIFDNDLYPAELGRESLSPVVDPWPVNPLTGVLMADVPGAAGDFTYTATGGGTDYSLTANLVGGGSYDVAAWTQPLFTPLWRMRVSLKDLCAQGYTQVLKDYVDEWQLAHGGALPTTDDMTAAGAVGQAQSWWPMSPWTGTAMAPGTAVGDFDYTPGPSSAFTVVLHQQPLPALPGHPETEYPPTYTAQ
jgi:hypothetical protein